MASQIDDLIRKYWNGDTSLQEELRIKEHFRTNPPSNPESVYFQAISGKSQSRKAFKHPGQAARRTWVSIAATLVLGLMVAFWVIRDARQTRDFVVEDPREAYEITRKALFMVSSTLNEASVYPGEIKKINEAERLLKETKK